MKKLELTDEQKKEIRLKQQRKAQKKYRENNKLKSKLTNYFTDAKAFIKLSTNVTKLQELKDLLDSKLKELQDLN